ncbi:CLIP domain-containing serine protease B15-like [Uranotaenia lowii]|uniref:CLIP domain-containing serine protease B15-like n=1 Tax=Uranotaenia lowii TaxID=190385 RepID=UPI00247963CD|nr:CLIP domain-containing serine protease B15-like [Uranotaenia lowii]
MNMLNISHILEYECNQNPYPRWNFFQPGGKLKVCCPTIDSVNPCHPQQESNTTFGGESLDIRDYPWVALIVYKDSRMPTCGGSLINSNHILSAAHCFDVKLLHRYEVRISERDWFKKSNCSEDGRICREIFEIKNIFIHENYTSASRYANIAVLRLENHVIHLGYIKPICLPSRKTFLDMNFSRVRLETVGWGETKNERYSQEVRRIELGFRSLELCKSVYHLEFLEDYSQFCAGVEHGTDSCVGDSGGSLMYRDGDHWVQLGLVSFRPDDCAQHGVPAVYTSVVYYAKWIVDTVLRE